MAFRLSRVIARRFAPGGAPIALCVAALALAGCNAQHQGELAAHASAPGSAHAGAADAPAAGAPASTPTQVALANEPDQPATATIDGVPLPPVRPDFAQLARERAEKEKQQAAGQPGAPAGVASAAPASAEAPEAGATTAARAYASPARPAGIFSIFMAAPADPAAPVQVAAAPENTGDNPAQRASLIAYERRVTGEDIAAAPAPLSTPAARPAFALAPAAVIEVAGVTREVGSKPAPALIGPAPQIAGAFGVGGRHWRPAYDHVVTHCFGPDLRAALDNIARHFNSEVLVTSGLRGNGRRKSMHRFCRAADIRVVGVSPSAVARYAATVPGVNGVGTYRRVSVTHVDMRQNQMAWRH